MKEWIEKAKHTEHHILSPGFDSKQQLAAHPEFVDLLAMNQTLMERWNRMVAPGDKVEEFDLYSLNPMNLLFENF